MRFKYHPVTVNVIEDQDVILDDDLSTSKYAAHSAVHLLASPTSHPIAIRPAYDDERAKLEQAMAVRRGGSDLGLAEEGE